MADNKQYLSILIDSLNKKMKILDVIIAENKKQTSLLKEEEFEEDAFIATMDHKEELINQIEELDNGFESVYDRIKDDVSSHPEEYRDELSIIQEIIPQLSAKSVTIEADEKRNDELVKSKLITLNRKIYQAKTTSKVAANYYNTMNATYDANTYFVDKKK